MLVVEIRSRRVVVVVVVVCSSNSSSRRRCCCRKRGGGGGGDKGQACTATQLFFSSTASSVTGSRAAAIAEAGTQRQGVCWGRALDIACSRIAYLGRPRGDAWASGVRHLPPFSRTICRVLRPRRCRQGGMSSSSWRCDDSASRCRSWVSFPKLQFEIRLTARCFNCQNCCLSCSLVRVGSHLCNMLSRAVCKGRGCPNIRKQGSLPARTRSAPRILSKNTNLLKLFGRSHAHKRLSDSWSLTGY